MTYFFTLYEVFVYKLLNWSFINVYWLKNTKKLQNQEKIKYTIIIFSKNDWINCANSPQNWLQILRVYRL